MARYDAIHGPTPGTASNFADRPVELCSRIERDLSCCDLRGQDMYRAGADAIDTELVWIDSSEPLSSRKVVGDQVGDKRELPSEAADDR
jgi:hypothetical protein